VPVSRVEFHQVAADVGLYLDHSALELDIGEVAVAAVDGIELTTVNRNNCVREEVQLLAENDELAADICDGLAAIPSEAGSVCTGYVFTRPGPVGSRWLPTRC